MQRHILEAALCHETESMQRVALALTKLTQDLKVNTVIAEFLFHKSVVSFRNMLPSFPCPTCGCEQGWR